MSILKIEDKKKWLNAFLALASVVIGFVMMRFCLQLGEWFDLEAKVPNFNLIIQAVGVQPNTSWFGKTTFYWKGSNANEYSDSIGTITININNSPVSGASSLEPPFNKIFNFLKSFIRSWGK